MGMEDGDDFKAMEGKRFRFKAGTPSQLRELVPGIVFEEVNTAQGVLEYIVVCDPTTATKIITDYSEDNEHNLRLEVDKKDTLGWLAQALKFPHQDPRRHAYTTTHRKILADFVAVKVAAIQNSPAVKDTVLSWLTRGLKRSLWIEANFMFLEGEMFTELDKLLAAKNLLQWSVLGHVAAKLVECGDISPHVLNDPDAANKLKIITDLVFPSAVAGFQDIKVIWDSKIQTVEKTRGTVLGAAATGVVSISTILVKELGGQAGC